MCRITESSTKLHSKFRSISLKHNPYRRWILYVYALITVSVSSGICYGWPALRRNLLVYPTESENYVALSEKRLGAAFTVGAVTTQGGRVIFGFVRDRIGTKYVTMTSLTLVIMGALGIALSESNNGIALATSVGLAGFGSGAQLCLQPVAQLFPQHTGVVLSSLSGSFMLSGSVFLILTSVTSNRKIAFLSYAGFIFLMLLAALSILPLKQSYQIDTKQTYSQQTKDKEELQLNDEVKATKEVKKCDETNDDIEEQSPSQISSNYISSTPTAQSQILSLEYGLLLLWFSACIVPLQYYVASIGFQLERKGDVNGVYTNFQQIMGACTCIASPVVGVFVDKFGLGFSQGLASTFNACAFFILSTGISLQAQTVGIVFYSFGRLCTFAYFFCNVGKRFGYVNYGALTGLGFGVTGIVSLLQYPLIALADDGYEKAVNLGCGATFVSVLPYCIWLWRREQESK